MNKVVDGGEALLQAKADRAKGDAVRESDVPDHTDHCGEDDHEGGGAAAGGGRDCKIFMRPKES